MSEIPDHIPDDMQLEETLRMIRRSLEFALQQDDPEALRAVVVTVTTALGSMIDTWTAKRRPDGGADPRR
jgi:hypothetical protein